jgi:hypothetical protein
MGGSRGKASLANTTDADILEYILAKLAARIEAKARTFLVKVKAHWGEPLNEEADDLAEETSGSYSGEGRGKLQMERTNNTASVHLLRQKVVPIGRKVHGVNPFAMQQGEGRRNL